MVTHLTLSQEPDIGSLGPEWDGIFGQAEDPQDTRAWYEATAEAALPDAAKPALLCIRSAGSPALLCPMLHADQRRLQSLTTPYTCHWQPIGRPDLSEADYRAAIVLIGRHCRRWSTVRFEALDEAWPKLPLFLSALREGGMRVRTFAHFGSWYVSTSAGWEPYLATRPGALRETIRRRTAAARRDPGISIRTYATTEEIAEGLSAYEAVYAKSWKEPEPFPNFNAALLKRLSRLSMVRLFVLFNRETPIAAQYWTVLAGTATVLKLAHVDGSDKLSPGTVLTAAAIRHFLEQEGVVRLDFGRGDDAYKKAWTGERRQKIGILAANMWRLGGLAAMARHDAGRLTHFRRSRGKINEVFTISR